MKWLQWLSFNLGVRLVRELEEELTPYVIGTTSQEAPNQHDDENERLTLHQARIRKRTREHPRMPTLEPKWRHGTRS